MRMIESRRVRAFRLALAKQIPKFPNTRETLKVLEAKPLGQLLIDYANWAIRYVAPRPRTVQVEPTASSDPRWHSLAGDIQRLLTKVEQGNDLTPHLSRQPHTRGFTPAASAPGPDVDRWADKDMLLNVMGYHHFHLDAAPHDRMRSDNVIFAHVTRDRFTVVGIFNHAVFDAPDPVKPMTAERDRLWQIFETRATCGAPPNSVVILSMTATSGHSMYFTNLAKCYARVIKKIDPKLDDPIYVRGLYQQAGVPLPKNPKLRWELKVLDLGLLDRRTDFFVALCKGPT
jgi:hypothetical protein